jgi:hypothetical protein
MEKWASVFEVYPNVKEIYVVKDMPFISKLDAENYAMNQNATVEVVLKAKAEKK